MPELPEVETIRRQLERAVLGRTIREVTVRFSGRLDRSAKKFVAAMRGAKISGIGRRAKLLLVHLADGHTLVAHLKMTGRFLLVPTGTPPTKHTHVIFTLTGGNDLFFEDTRKFGYLKIVPTKKLEETLFRKNRYGPEPLGPGFGARGFSACVRRHPTKRIKPLLMDQTCIAGIGNIYADEACWRAKVKPMRKVSSLTDAETRGIFAGAVTSMKAAIAARGTSADTYLDLYGRPGKYLPKLKVYDRQGETCRRCGGTIVKIRLGGRGTHYCPRCQH